jgi:peptidyl-prolyl cis-trans isomerase D
MFNLFRSRTKAVKYLLTALLSVVALSMVTYLIPGYMTSEDSNDQIVADIGKESLTVREAEESLRRALKSKQLPQELVQLYVPQIIDQMIAERALAYEAERLGFDVSKDELADTIRMSIPSLFPNGEFAGTEAYASFLAQQNMSIQEFERNLRKQMLLTRLKDLVLEGVVVTPMEVVKEYQRKNNKVKLDYVAFSPDKLRAQAAAAVTAKEVQDYYAKNGAQYKTAEKRGFDVLVIDPGRISETLTIPDADLMRKYNANLDHYRIPERVNVRHILLKTTDKPPAEIPKIQAKAEDLLKQLKGGADFAELAKKYSEDPGSGSKGGDLGWVTRGQTVKPFEDAAFSLKPKELSGVIKTEYGFHIIQVLEKESAHVKPFSEVKNELAQDNKKQLINERLQTLADQGRAALAKDPRQGEAIAKELGISFVRVDKAAPGDPIPQVGINKEFEDTVAGLKKGEVSQVTQIPGNKLVVVTVTNIFPSEPAGLAEVEGKIRQTLIESKVAQLLNERVAQLLSKAKADGNDLQKAAKSMGMEVKTTQEFGLDGAADGIGSATALTQAFTLGTGEVFGPVKIGDQQFICKVQAKVPADMSKLVFQQADIVAAVKKSKVQERDELFEDGLVTRLVNEKKIIIHKDVIKRLVASYRG